MTQWLRRQGHQVNPKRIRRLLRQMGLEAIYPRPRGNLSLPDKEHKIYPYLLRGVAITRPDQVWSTDITYIRMYHGWVYLTAIMDWFSRYVLSWRLSITLENDFCIEALDEALRRHGAPDLFNSDQGPQFTSDAFTGRKTVVRLLTVPSVLIQSVFLVPTSSESDDCRWPQSRTVDRECQGEGGWRRGRDQCGFSPFPP